MEVTATAVHDLNEMRDWLQNQGAPNAREFIADLVRQISKIADAGLTGFPRDRLSPGLRAFPYRGRCFYFTMDDDTLYLVHVYHGRQLVQAEDFPPNR